MVDCSVVRHREEVFPPMRSARRDGGLFRRPSPRRGTCSSACHATRWWTVPSSVTAKRYMLLSLPMRRDGGLFRRPSPRRGICSSACHATRWWTVRRPSPCRHVQPSVVLEVRPPWVRIESVRAVGLVECVVRLDVFRRCAPRDAMVDCSVVRHREEVYAPQLATRRDGGLFRRPSQRRGICSSACLATRWWTVRRPSPCRYVQPSVVLEVRPPWVRIESVRAVGLVEC